MTKKKKGITITPIGYSAEGVTGSCNLIEFNERKILVELGGIQEGHTVLSNYNMNRKMLEKIKPSEIEAVFVCHLHYDHIGLIPYLFHNRTCEATIHVPKGSVSILKEMWLDSAKIMESDCDHLNHKFGRSYEPFYNKEDIEIALTHIEENESDFIYELDEILSFRYVPSGHIMLAQQIELFIKISNHTNKILITSDLGNVITEDKRIFVEKFEPVIKANVVIAESTYGRRSKRNTKKDLDKDLEKIKSVISQFCIDSKHRVLIPTFSLDKTAVMLWYLYDIYGQDSEFKVPVIVDSPLAIRLLNCYSSILTGELKNKFEEMMTWPNIKLISEYEESAACMASSGAKIIIAAGGMLQSGRSVMWAQKIVPCAHDCILFTGHCGEDTLGYKLKNLNDHKTVTINNKVVKNKCYVVECRSFSSHRQNNDLINYYKNIQADCIYLVHGDPEARHELKEDLEKEIANMSKTTKVKIANKSTVIKL